MLAYVARARLAEATVYDYSTGLEIIHSMADGSDG